jgi:hypothetical protein
MVKDRKITLFRFKTKEEKMMVQLKKKIALIEKIKAEVKTMGRLVLKDGKLQSAETTQKIKEVPQEVPTPFRQYEEPSDYIELPVPKQQAPQQQYQAPQQQYQAPQRQAQPQVRPQQEQFQQPPTSPSEILVEIVLTGDITLPVRVPMQSAQAFLDEIGMSIASGSVLTIGNRGINSRNIVMYSYE